MDFPETRKTNFAETLHGITVRDPYRWLEGNGKDVKQWVDRQDQFAHKLLSRLPQERVFASKFKKLLKTESLGVPYAKNGFYFTTDRKPSEDMGVLYVRKGISGKKKVLIDPNKLSKNKTTTLRQWSVTEDGALLAYALSESGNDQNGIFVLDVRTGKKLKDHIPAEYYPALYSGIAWNPDGKGFWYSRRKGNAAKGQEKMNQKLFYHRLGDDFLMDELVFGKAIAPDEFPSASASRDGRYLLVSRLVTSGKVRRNDLYLKDLSDPDGAFKTVVEGLPAEFLGWMHRDSIYVSTNYQAPNWRVIKISLNNATAGIKHWTTIIPERRYPHDDFLTVKNTLFLRFLEDAYSVVRMYDLAGNYKGKLPLPLGTVDSLFAEEESDEIFFRLTSFTIPNRIYRFDMIKKSMTVFYDKKVKGVTLDHFITRQIWFRSKDGTKVPMFLVHKKGLLLNGKNPVLLYGYGGFNISQTPTYGAMRIAFLEKGGVYVMPNIRGGGEFGEAWHKAGIRKKKQNVFDDFIGAAEWLIKNKYTDKEHIAAFGWSNGGLLTGAMITQRPDLFKAVIVGAPVADMIRFHKFNAGRYWIPEYGDPDDPKMIRTLLKYSPYHQIKDGVAYPATLVVTAEGDDRVHPSHAYKFAARLQNATRSDNPIVITIERKAGHSGAASVSNVIRQYSSIYGFIAWQLGMR